MFKTSKSANELTKPVTHTMRPSMNIWNSFTLGFAVVSPIVGLYAIIGVQTTVTGGGWFAALVICLLMQLLVATVYAELSSQFPIAGGAYKWARQLYGITAGHYAGVIYVSSTIAMLTTTAYAGGIWFAGFFGSEGESGSEKVLWAIIFLALCTLLNLVHVNIFKLVIKLGVYAEVVGSLGIAILLFLFFRQHSFVELFQHLGTGTAPSSIAAFLAALAIAGWAFIGFDACSTTAEETHQPEHAVPRAIFFSLCTVGTVVIFNSASLVLAFDHDVLTHSSVTADPITPLIASHFGAWIEKPFLAIVMIAFLACGASVVKYTSRIVFSMAREGNLPGILNRVTPASTPRNAILFTVLLASCGLIFGLNDDAVATIIAFGTGGLYAMFAFTTGVALFARLTGRWNPDLGQLKLGIWGLVINSLAFAWALFELINIAWPRPYAIAADAPWWQLWATPLVLGSMLSVTTIYLFFGKLLRSRS
ncbi:APC family permease [Nitrosomonas ureae]|uniref:Amino acid transporter n=1 Tax=Nitrosomonas ureae TaxID=44577 RepID=A0A1H9BY44_9PROT|nr:APC family permease [Nitrosomonas ureae]SEP93905.1 Amino acid transporter [Nitrosomonas ureae]